MKDSAMKPSKVKALKREQPVNDPPRHRKRRGTKAKPWALQIRGDKDRFCLKSGDAFHDWTTMARYETREQAEQAVKAKYNADYGSGRLWEVRVIGPNGETISATAGEKK